MRPFFFKRYTPPAPDKRAVRYQAKQREDAATPRLGRGQSLVVGILSLFGGFFGANREVAAWLRTQDTGLPIHIVKSARDKSLAAARAKRERRLARNLRWWARDTTWRRA
jgi:hypothetical protein